MHATAERNKAGPVSRTHDEPGVYAFRVFYLRINDRPRVVGAWKLYETLRALSLATKYSSLANLAENESLEFSAIVHRSPITVAVVAGTWQLRISAAPTCRAS